MPLLVVFACNTDEVDPPAQAEVSWAKSEMAISASIDLIQELAFKGIAATSPSWDRDEGSFLSCAIVREEVIDTITRVVTMDFGSGCTGVFSNVWKGKLFVKHDGKIWDDGSTIVVSADSFRIDGLLVEGTFTMIYDAQSASPGKIHEVILKEGKFIFPDGRFITREETLTRTWVRSLTDPLKDIVKIVGSATGSDQEKETYSIAILEAVVTNRACMYEGQNVIPVFGKKEIKAKDLFFLVDYGEGLCNTKVVLTKDGKSKVIWF